MKERKDKTADLYLWVLLPCGIGAFLWAVVRFPAEKINVGLLALAFVTIFLSSYLRIQLPRTKIHLTISDALVFLSMLLYGGPVAVLLATLETIFAAWTLRRHGVRMKKQTVLINVLIAAFSTFVTYSAVSLIFGPPDHVFQHAGTSAVIWILSLTALSQFLTNSLSVAAFVALRTETEYWRVWNEYCLNSLAIYVGGAAMAGIAAKAVQQTNMFLFAAVIAFFSIVYLTYRRQVDDIVATAARAEDSERKRAEQAEDHVKELQHYVGELEKSGEALRESHESFRHAAYHDPLTGLPNRRYFLERLKLLIERSADGSGSKFALLFLDINRFKTVNDSLGHSAGDELICHVAARMTAAAGPNSMVGRFSGDEFAVLLTNVCEATEVTLFADRAAARIAEPFELGGRSVFVSVSIGIAFDDSKYTVGEEILRDADIAMYYAKENQKNWVIFDQKMHARAISLLEVETDLRYAIENDQLELYYQPIIDLDQMRLSGFEALVRWNHPTRGLVSPGEFISVSEDTGLIVPMTIQLLHKACRQLVEWQRRSIKNECLTINVNISGKHFTEGDLVAQIKTVLAKTQIDPAYLKLEITETAVMENAEHAISMLNQIKATGVCLSVDDFGTGYSSLSYLHRFPIDTLKIDRSFVSAMEDGTENGEIVKAVIALAAALNLNVVAEGIESVAQLGQLRSLGCEYGQGYLFSRPLPVREIERLFDDPSRWPHLWPDAQGLILPHEEVISNLMLVQ
jgi:diguanylate cyclase (GGDEF)-like protein